MKKVRLVETILEKSEAVDDARPGPTFVSDFENIDLQDVAGRGAFNEYRTRERMNAAAIDGEKFRDSHSRMYLRATRIETRQMQAISGCDAKTRRKHAIPARVGGIRGKSVTSHCAARFPLSSAVRPELCGEELRRQWQRGRGGLRRRRFLRRDPTHH